MSTFCHKLVHICHLRDGLRNMTCGLQKPASFNDVPALRLVEQQGKLYFGSITVSEI